MTAKDLRRLMRRDLDAATLAIAQRDERVAKWTFGLLWAWGLISR